MRLMGPNTSRRSSPESVGTQHDGVREVFALNAQTTGAQVPNQRERAFEVESVQLDECINTVVNFLYGAVQPFPRFRRFD